MTDRILATSLTGAASTPDLSGAFNLLASSPAWHARAACKQHPEVNFYPDTNESAEPAKQVCASCPVIREYLAAAALPAGGEHGVWGGTSRYERARRRTAAA